MKKRRLQVGLPCVWSGGRQLPPPATLSPRSPADCLLLSCRASSSSAFSSFCLSFRSVSSSSSSSSLRWSWTDFGGWAFPQLSSDSLSELERYASAEGGCCGLGGSEPAEKRGREIRLLYWPSCTVKSDFEEFHSPARYPSSKDSDSVTPDMKLKLISHIISYCIIML